MKKVLQLHSVSLILYIIRIHQRHCVSTAVFNLYNIVPVILYSGYRCCVACLDFFRAGAICSR